MEKSNLIKTIYVYVLLTTSIIILMVNSVSALNSVVDLVYPTPYIQTYDEFVMSKQNGITPRPVSIDTKPITLPADTATPSVNDSGTTREAYDIYKTETTDREKRDISKRIIKQIIWVAASGVLLWFALREKKSLTK
jgi:hypothetical protein